MRLSIQSLHAHRVGKALRPLAFLLITFLLSIFASPEPTTAMLPRAGRSQPGTRLSRADAVGVQAPASFILPALDPRYDLEGVQTAKLLPTDVGSDALFGYSMAISGNTLVVGARGAQVAYVFTRDASSGAWQQVARLGQGLQGGPYT